MSIHRKLQGTLKKWTPQWSIEDMVRFMTYQQTMEAFEVEFR